MRAIGALGLATAVASGAIAAVQPAPLDLTDQWVYAGTDGRVKIVQTGERLAMELTYLPNSAPPPHYLIDAVLAGRSIDGTWKCVTAVCQGQRGKFHADVNAEGNHITISRTEDPGINGWNAMSMERTAAGAASMARSLESAGSVAIYDILFDVDKAVIKPASKPILDEIARLLKTDPALELEVSGHTDNTGTPQHNLALSKSRADAVVAALVRDYAIARTRLEARGYGDSRPVAPNDTEQNRANNRRVELRKR